MATSFTFDGKKIIEPDVYSRVQAISDNPPFDADYGGVLIIDTGTGANWGAGSGVSGTLKQNADSVLTYDNITAFKNDVRGGIFWKLSEMLFRPDGFGINGISKLHFVKAAQTVPAEISYTFTGGLSIGDISYSVAFNSATDVTVLYENESNGNLFVGTNSGTVYQSTDGGTTWSDLVVGASSAITGISTDSSNNIYVTTDGEGVYQSTDSGSTWTQINTSLTNLRVTEIAIDSADVEYITTYDGVWKYSGSSWSQVLSGVGRASTVAIDSSDNIYVGVPSDDVYKSTDGGSTFNSFGNGITDISNDDVYDVFVDNNDNIFVSTDSGVWKRSSGGSGFNSSDSGIGEVVKDFAEEAGNNILFAISDSKVYRSTDGGVVWDEQTGSISTNNFTSAIVDNNNYLFVAETGVGIYQSDSTVEGSGSNNGGSVVVQVNNEGPVGNGSTNTNNVLTQGYAAKMRASDQTSGKYVIDFFRGRFKGTDSAGDPWDFIPESDYTDDKLLVVSPEFNDIQTLIDWMNDDVTFQEYFTLKTSSVNGSGAVDSDDLSNNTGYNLASGGTETYNNTELDNVLNSISELNYTFALSDRYGTSDARGTQNDKILSHLINDAKYDKFMFVGGGSNRNEFNTTNGSVGIAQYFDHEKAHVVHGDYYQIKPTGGMKKYDAIFKTASILGRTAGIEPQTPVTFKGITMAKDEHVLSKSERITALQNGVMFTKFDSVVSKFIVEMGINTIQNNQNVVNRNGKSYLLSFNRIAAYLNKLLIINARITLLDTQSGPNVNTISQDDLREFTRDVLSDNTASDNDDDLIIEFRNITTSRIQDAYEVQYEFMPNLEINKLFFTGRAVI